MSEKDRKRDGDSDRDRNGERERQKRRKRERERETHRHLDRQQQNEEIDHQVEPTRNIFPFKNERIIGKGETRKSLNNMRERRDTDKRRSEQKREERRILKKETSRGEAQAIIQPDGTRERGEMANKRL